MNVPSRTPLSPFPSPSPFPVSPDQHGKAVQMISFYRLHPHPPCFSLPFFAWRQEGREGREGRGARGARGGRAVVDLWW
jgi:hypothetical protein